MYAKMTLEIPEKKLRTSHLKELVFWKDKYEAVYLFIKSLRSVQTLKKYRIQLNVTTFYYKQYYAIVCCLM